MDPHAKRPPAASGPLITDTFVDGSAPTSEHARAPVPLAKVTIGRYELRDRLGAGAMSTVFLAHDPGLDRKLAIKLLSCTGRGPNFQLRLRREAQAMARISHTHVVAVYDVGAFNDELFLAMEYVEGGTLAEWLEQPRSWEQVLEVFVGAGRGLAAAHAAGLIHRDFKPANVLINTHNHAKVTDFGLVCASQAPPAPDPHSPRSALETPLTQAGAVLGTPAYMSPEQFFGQPADARSDQFAFCVALHEALWGVAPFVGRTMEELGQNMLHNRRNPRPPDTEVPPRLEPIIERGLERLADRRWASMEELLEALSQAPPRQSWWAALGARLRRR